MRPWSVGILEMDDRFEANLWNEIVVEEEVGGRGHRKKDERRGDEEEGAEVGFDGGPRGSDIDGCKHCRPYRHLQKTGTY